MSGVGRWSLGIGLFLVAVAVVFRLLDLIPVTVIAGILGLVGIGIAVYDAIYEGLQQAQSKRTDRRRSGDS